MLHAWLILSLLVMPAARLARADGEDGYTWTSTESSVSVTAWASEGTSGMQQGDSRQVTTYAELNTWQVWTNAETGATEYRDAQTIPLTGAGMTFSASADGSVSPSSTTTDGGGNAVTSFTAGTAASTVTATVTQYGATGSVTFETPTIPETWTWDHDESLISASLSTTASTDNVPNGATRQVQAHVEVTSWPVYRSNYNNTRAGDQTTSPAIGASVSWSVENGDGSVSGSSSTDGTGNVSATFTMGSAISIVRADVSYATSSATYATLQFNPEPVETWTYDHMESSVSGLTLSANGNTDSLAPGTVRTVTANVTGTTYEVWVSNFGGTQHRNETPGPVSGTAVSFTLDYGNSALSGYSGTTDANGNASVDFTMATQASQVSASAAGYSASIGFYPAAETWSYDRTVSSLALTNFTADGSTDDLRPGNTRTLTAEVTRTSYEVWVSNYGNSQDRNSSSSAGDNVTVSFSVTAGDGTVTPSSATTDGAGHATTAFTMGSQASTVQASVNDGANTLSASITLGLGAPVWAYDHTETTIATTLTADSTTNSLPVGATRLVTANVSFNSWEIWRDDTGTTEPRNNASGAANGASIYFFVSQGDGTLSGVASSTDSNGNATATFTMGSQASTVQADASYAGASSYGTLDFTPDPWTYYHSQSTLAVSLAADQTASTVTASVTVTTWDIYTNGSSYEERNRSSGPAGNAPVTFTAGGSASIAYGPVSTDTAGSVSSAYSCSADSTGTITANVSFMGATGSATTDVAGPQTPPLNIDTPGLGNATVGVNYSAALSGSGGSGTYTWSPSNFPTGLGIDSSSGTISWTPPTAAGTYDVTVTLSDTTGHSIGKTFYLTVNASPVEITTSQLSEGTVDVAYSSQVSATGGTGSYSFSWEAYVPPGGSFAMLPPGLSMGSDGLISGTPTAGWAYDVTVRVQDSASGSDTKIFTINIAYPLVISTPALPDGMVGEGYSTLLTGWGGSGSYTWSVSALPDGLYMQSSGSINGTPTTAGTTPFTVYLSDGTTGVTKELSITIVSTLEIGPASLPDGTVHEAYSAQVYATGGTSPYVFSWEPFIWYLSTPPGLSMGSDGAISGTPTEAGFYWVTVKAQDSATNPQRTASRVYGILIRAALDITTANLKNGIVGVSYSDHVDASGGTPPYTWFVTSLPDGLTMDAATGTISGTPTTPGTYPFTVYLEDEATYANGYPWKDYSITIEPVEFITPAGDPVNAPTDGDAAGGAPDGANEFTFNDAASGVLTLTLKVKAAGVGSLPAAEQAKFSFEVDAIGTSALSWVGNNATVSGDYVTATAKFTGLPQSNSDFGLKTARIKYGTATLAESEFEVFFSRDATNHPDGQANSPNWFFYWSQTVTLLGSNPVVEYAAGNAKYNPNTNKIYLGPKERLSYEAP